MTFVVIAIEADWNITRLTIAFRYSARMVCTIFTLYNFSVVFSIKCHVVVLSIQIYDMCFLALTTENLMTEMTMVFSKHVTLETTLHIHMAAIFHRLHVLQRFKLHKMNSAAIRIIET